MFLRSPLNLLLLLPAILTTVSVLASTIACNNSPSLCSKQYNNITYLGAHDSPFVRDAQTGFSTAGNQYYNTTLQLMAGVRLLTAQIQFSNATESLSNLHVCHTSCILLDAGSFSSWLMEIREWMDKNPNEVVTVLLVNGAAATAEQLNDEYETAGITKYAYTPTFTQATTDWPTLQTLIDDGTRLMTFISGLTDNTGWPYLMNEYKYIFENSYENTSPNDYSCEPQTPPNVANQTELAINDGYMSLMNHFLYENQAFGIQTPNTTYITTTNAPSGGLGNLGSSAATCAGQYGQNPTFLVVDFFNVGPAIEVADYLNNVTNPIGRLWVSPNIENETSGAVGLAKPSMSVLLALGFVVFVFLHL